MFLLLIAAAIIYFILGEPRDGLIMLVFVIDQTCSIVLERQPAETDIMERDPRNPKEKLLNAKILFKSVIQGLVIFAASFGTYMPLCCPGTRITRLLQDLWDLPYS